MISTCRLGHCLRHVTGAVGAVFWGKNACWEARAEVRGAELLLFSFCLIKTTTFSKLTMVLS